MFNQSYFVILLEKIINIRNIKKSDITTLLGAEFNFLAKIKSNHTNLKPSQYFKICNYLTIKPDILAYYCNDDNFTITELEEINDNLILEITKDFSN